MKSRQNEHHFWCPPWVRRFRVNSLGSYACTTRSGAVITVLVIVIIVAAVIVVIAAENVVGVGNFLTTLTDFVLAVSVQVVCPVNLLISAVD
jgi:hypothetical protein